MLTKHKALAKPTIEKRYCRVCGTLLCFHDFKIKCREELCDLCLNPASGNYLRCNEMYLAECKKCKKAKEILAFAKNIWDEPLVELTCCKCYKEQDEKEVM